jgi:hypothetical protein
MRIGLTGIARSGKDTVAKMMKELVPFDHPIVSLAAPIKAVFSEACGWNERHADGDLKEVSDYYKFDRDKMIEFCIYNYGLEVSDSIDQVNKFFKAVNEDDKSEIFGYNICHISPRRAYQLWGTVFRDKGANFWLDMLPEKCICPDVRYDNEAEAMDLVYKVVRPGNGVVAVAHASENGISENLVALTIINDRTLDYLHRVVEQGLEYHGVLR